MVLTSEIVVICAEPDRLQLEAVPERPQGPCPLLAKTGRIAALCYEDLKINLAVFDSLGRKLDNYSSADISWQNSDTTLTEIQQEIGVIFPDPKPEAFYKPFANGYQILHNKNTPGDLEITGIYFIIFFLGIDFFNYLEKNFSIRN